ncbi:MAG: cyclase family protein [Albidovulum sp.]|nr:cyclase family protein [Albidovulum sp.]
MQIVDLAQKMEPHWLWASYPFISQSYFRGDEFLEFGFHWRGSGFSFVSSPGWRRRGGRHIESYPLGNFAGVANIVDVRSASPLSASSIERRLLHLPNRDILLLRTGHADAVNNRRPDYWIQAPEILPGCAAAIAAAGYRHVAIDLSCDDIPAFRPGGEGGFKNPNGEFRAELHAQGMVLTENCMNFSVLNRSEVFFAALPYAIPESATAPCRPIAMLDWPSDVPRIIDVSTPIFNHWRWKFDVRQGRSLEKGDRSEEIHFLITGHGFTHCDAPCHMRKSAATIQDLPNEGLDLFIREAVIADFSDLELPFPITPDMLDRRLGGRFRPGDILVLRSDLTNKLGYESREWHLKAPNLERETAEYITRLAPSAVALDFPQDYIAREMPERHVYNHEFVAHHAVFAAGIPFIEDLKNLGDALSERPMLMAVPLKTSCVDGSLMRAVMVEW